MYLCDSHIHTEYSYDSSADLLSICRAAVECGLSEIAVTDHYDANIIEYKMIDDLNVAGVYQSVLQARESFPQLEIAFGVELGEPAEMPEKTKELLSRAEFDFVLGSVHNLPTTPDFYFLDFTKFDQRHVDSIYKMYLETTAKNIEFSGFDSLAHLGYPMRYIYDGGKSVDLLKYRDDIADIFKMMIKRDIALEVNTSGVNRKMHSLIPGASELRLYRELGGKLLTIGSDAHITKRIGEHIKNTHELLKEIGFKTFNVYHGRKAIEKEL